MGIGKSGLQRAWEGRGVTDSVVAQLFDFGALGIFAAFLVWQYMGMQKRLDGLVARFTEQLDKINTDYDERIEGMRVRYDAVINQLRDENAQGQREFFRMRQEVQSEVVERLNENARKLDDALREIKECTRNA